MLTLWGRRSSFNVQKVMWLLAELDVRHDHIEAGGAFGGLDEPEFRARNPHGRVPVIEDDGLVVWESQAILRYLAARYGASRFWPDDPARRAQIDQWMDWSQTRLQPDFLVGVFWGFYRTPAEQRDEQAVGRAVARCGRHFLLLDTLLKDRTHLLGEDPTLADIVIGTHLYRYLNIDIERPPLPRVSAWYAALAARPAFRTGVMIPFDDLYGRLDY